MEKPTWTYKRVWHFRSTLFYKCVHDLVLSLPEKGISVTEESFQARNKGPT